MVGEDDNSSMCTGIALGGARDWSGSCSANLVSETEGAPTVGNLRFGLTSDSP